ncbi:MAG: hypothetical protein EBX81_04220 [bacterium]|nr:hypothetical protein [Candidatus Aquidulcis sp.]
MSTSLSTADLTDLPRAQERELLLGNGLGGYTALSPLGAPGRRYHGLLVAALQPPVARTVLVGPPMLWARTDGDWLPLFTFEIEPDRFSPQLGAPLREVAVGVGGVTKEWALPTGRLTERHSAIPGANAVLLTFCLEAAATSGVDLLLRLTATAHDHHDALVGDLTCATSGVDERAQQGTWRMSSEWPEVQVRCDGGALAVDAGAIRGLFHRHDAARVEADRSDYAVPLRWSVRLEPGESASEEHHFSPRARRMIAICSHVRKQSVMVPMPRSVQATSCRRSCSLLTTSSCVEEFPQRPDLRIPRRHSAGR